MAERPDILDTYSALPSDERLGFLVAIHSMPEFLQPSAWMGELRSEEVGFRDMEDAQAFFDALMELYNRVGQTLRSDSPTDDLYPDLEDPDAVARWCRGYLRAIDLQRTLPDEDDVTSVPLMLFAVLSGETRAQGSLPSMIGSGITAGAFPTTQRHCGTNGRTRGAWFGRGPSCDRARRSGGTTPAPAGAGRSTSDAAFTEAGEAGLVVGARGELLDRRVPGTVAAGGD